MVRCFGAHVCRCLAETERRPLLLVTSKYHQDSRWLISRGSIRNEDQKTPYTQKRLFPNKNQTHYEKEDPLQKQRRLLKTKSYYANDDWLGKPHVLLFGA